MSSCQLWLPRGQAHVESSLPSGLVPVEATIGSYPHVISLPSGLVPVEATIGSYTKLE